MQAGAQGARRREYLRGLIGTTPGRAPKPRHRLGVKELGVAGPQGEPVATAEEETSETGPSPWTPYQGSGFEVEAGEVCDFTLRGELLSDKERYRVAETYPDGSTWVEEWTGQLVFRFVNAETGESVRRNLTGRGDSVYHEDGSWSLVNVGGHIGVGLHPGDDPAKRYYVISGAGYELTEDTAGHRTLTPGDGNAENICETLS